MLTRIWIQGHTTSQSHFLGHIQTIKLHHPCLYLPCSTLQCHVTFREHLLSLNYQYFRSRSLATSLILNMVEVTLTHCRQRVHLHTVVMTYASRIGTGSEYRTSWYLPYMSFIASWSILLVFSHITDTWIHIALIYFRYKKNCCHNISAFSHGKKKHFDQTVPLYTMRILETTMTILAAFWKIHLIQHQELRTQKYKMLSYNLLNQDCCPLLKL